MKVIYVAGPFRAPNSWEIEQNIRRAEALYDAGSQPEFFGRSITGLACK